MADPQSPRSFLLKRKEIDDLDLTEYPHQHNPVAIRHTASLGDKLGFTDMGVHIVRVKPGSYSSEHHNHEEDEEFIYIISGNGIAHIGDEMFNVTAGDFLGFPKNSPAHHLHNSYDKDLVFMAAGTRCPIDIVNYPRVGLRQYRVHGRREWTKDENLTRGGLQPWMVEEDET